MYDPASPALSAICSNLEKACVKQLRSEEAALFGQLALYFNDKRSPIEDKGLGDLIGLLKEELATDYPACNRIASTAADRGTLRALTWGEKVTKLQSALLARYSRQQNDLLEHTNLFVCDICGFVYVGDEPPEICPICKVPNAKILKISREN